MHLEPQIYGSHACVLLHALRLCAGKGIIRVRAPIVEFKREGKSTFSCGPMCVGLKLMI